MRKFRLLLSARSLCARAGFCSSVEEVSSFDTRAHIKMSVPPTPKVADIFVIAVVTTMVVVTVIMLIRPGYATSLSTRWLEYSHKNAYCHSNTKYCFS